MDDATIRSAYRSAADRRGSDRAGCPPAEVVQQLATASAHGDASAEAFDHVMACRACQGEYELLRALHLGTAQAAPARPPRPARRWVPAALAASTMIAAVALGAYLRSTSDRGSAVDELQMRGGDDGVTVVSGATAVRGDSLRLSWRRVPEAEAYRVSLLTVDGAPLYEGVTGDTTVALAPSLLPPSLRAVDWLVVARRADGNEQRSPLHRVTVDP